MKIDLASAAADDATSAVGERLEEAGHDIQLGDAGPGASRAVVVLVSRTADPARMFSIWERVDAARSAQVPVIGASLDDPYGLPTAVSAIPHDGAWIEVHADRKGISPLLEVLDSIEAVDGTVRDDGEEVTGEPPPDDEHAAEPGAGWRDRRFGRVVEKGLHGAALVPTRTRDARERVRVAIRSEEEGSKPLQGSVFISYSRRDKLARDVCDELRLQGYDVWVDTESIPGAANWRVGISRGIKAADAVVLLMSPNVAKEPKHVRSELELAQARDKPIVPVMLKPTPTPEGFDVMIGGLQYIDLHADFTTGIRQLVNAIGGEALASHPGLRERAKRGVRRTRRLAHQHEVGRTLAKYGSSAVVGAAAIAVVVTKGIAEQQEQERKETRARTQLAREQYLERTNDLLRRAIEEVEFTEGMGPEEYRDEFRPKYAHILGKLEATVPDDPRLKERHDRLVADLDRVGKEFDAVMRKRETGDAAGFARAAERTNRAWVATITSMIEWINQAIDPPA